MRFRERLARFMAGRYGIDRLYHFLLVICFVLIVINLFARHFLISFLELVILAYAAFRVLSRNIYKRQQENLKFMKLMEKPTKFFNLQKCKIRDRKTHVFKRCPTCKNKLRLSKLKG
jgi:1,4-dihydroxy-2-naphthoate octaprenyltransferase